MNRTLCFIFLISTILLLSCAGEEGLVTRSLSEVTFVCDSIQTRSTQEGVFERGDAIGVFACRKGGTIPYLKNSKYVYDGSRFVPAAGAEKLMNGGDEPDIYLYYPYRSDAELDRVPAIVKNQRGKNDWLESDFLTAEHKGRIENDVVKLKFRHRFATIVIDVKNPAGMGTIVLKSVRNRITHNMVNGVSTMQEGSQDIELFPFRSAGNSVGYKCCVPADTKLSSRLIHLAYLDGELFKFNFPSGARLSEGKILHLTADMEKKEMKRRFTVSPMSINAEGVSGSREVTVVSEEKYQKGGKNFTHPIGYEVDRNIPDWLTLEKQNGETYRLSWKENPGEDMRIGIVRFRQPEGNRTITVTVNQSGSKRTISEGPWRTLKLVATAEPENIASTGGSSTIKVVRHRKREIRTFVNGRETSVRQESGIEDITKQSEITKKGGFGTLSENIVTMDKNETAEVRTGTYLVRYEGVPREVLIRQDAAKIIYGQYIFRINLPNNLPVDNSKYAEFTLVVESGREINIDGDVQKKNIPYKIQTTSEWIRVEDNKVIVEENFSLRNRIGKILITQSHSNKIIEVTITQQRKYNVRG